MIKNIIFDFGDVFINLDKQVLKNLDLSPEPEFYAHFERLNDSFEIGRTTETEFLDALIKWFPKHPGEKLRSVWNSMLLDLPEYRLEFLENLAAAGRHRLFLLSNTNALHIPHVASHIGQERFDRFKNCFERFYLSHEIGLRKPHPEIFEFVLKENGLVARETLFVDDTRENTLAAGKLGIQTWHLRVGTEDVVELNSRL